MQVTVLPVSVQGVPPDGGEQLTALPFQVHPAGLIIARTNEFPQVPSMSGPPLL
jgi:hypothetical protein